MNSRLSHLCLLGANLMNSSHAHKIHFRRVRFRAPLNISKEDPCVVYTKVFPCMGCCVNVEQLRAGSRQIFYTGVLYEFGKTLGS